jgi:hypothetical protein
MVTHLYVDGPYDGAELRGARDTIEQALLDRAIDLPATPGAPPGRVVEPDTPLPAGCVRYVLDSFQGVSSEETVALYRYRPSPGEPS